jgi:predicted NBD/HSP70 family sugar kinase
VTGANAPKRRRILVLDVGGTHVKAGFSDRPTEIKIASGPSMGPEKMMRKVAKVLRGQRFDAVTIGYPGLVIHGRILREPHNLGPGWVGFDFERAFRRPTRLLNDAAMQALGSYRGGRMLFLGLGTGLGTAMIVDGRLEPMELAHLPYKKGKTYEDYVGEAGLLRLGRKKWQREVEEVVRTLVEALEPEYVVLGGGNVRKLKKLPPHCERGDNRDAIKGGVRIWTAPPEAPVTTACVANLRRGRVRDRPRKSGRRRAI